jgi:hypothetical protein
MSVPAFIPSPEEIAEAARQIREEGYVSEEWSHRGEFRSPWFRRRADGELVGNGARGNPPDPEVEEEEETDLLFHPETGLNGHDDHV